MNSASESAFGIDHGDVSKAFNPMKAFKAARKTPAKASPATPYKPPWDNSPKAIKQNQKSFKPAASAKPEWDTSPGAGSPQARKTVMRQKHANANSFEQRNKFQTRSGSGSSYRPGQSNWR